MYTYNIFPGYDYVFQFLLRDLENEENINVYKNIYRCHDIFFQKILKKILFSPLDFMLSGIFRKFTSRFLIGCLRNIDIDKQYIFVFSNISIGFIDTGILKRLERANNVKLVLYLLDGSKHRYGKRAIDMTKKVKFDLVYTFDTSDSQKYNFQHFYTMYPKISKVPMDCKYDLSFIGGDKKRFEILSKIYDKFEVLDAKLYFNIFYPLDDNLKEQYINKITYDQFLLYDDVVRITCQSNCILDVVIGEQTGLSLRALEAVTYNKKLLTNNPSIKEFPFYDERYMKVFDTVDDIDLEFVMKHENVQYSYKGEYSPKNFLRKIEKDLERMATHEN